MGKSKSSKTSNPLVAIVMGSQSDWETMKHAADVLAEFKIEHECEITSAHRTPVKMARYATEAHEKGIAVIIAGAGGAAHLPGMVAAHTHLPVLGVPVESHALKGLDSLLSIVQMPAGVPVGSLAIGKAGATNAALLAVSILALSDSKLSKALQDYRARQTARVEGMKLGK
jgi:5-(carboxyamino)imidazole ribonucleotide mutase